MRSPPSAPSFAQVSPGARVSPYAKASTSRMPTGSQRAACSLTTKPGKRCPFPGKVVDTILLAQQCENAGVFAVATDHIGGTLLDVRLGFDPLAIHPNEPVQSLLGFLVRPIWRKRHTDSGAL